MKMIMTVIVTVTVMINVIVAVIEVTDLDIIFRRKLVNEKCC